MTRQATTALLVALAACASSGDAFLVLPEAGNPADASAPEDGGIEDAPVDAPARTCSDENFCHTRLPPNQTLRDVWGSGRVVWSVSEQGDVLRWNGATWIIHATKLGALHAVWGSGPTDLWIGGVKGIFHGTGASPETVTFEPMTVPGAADVPLRSIWGTSATDIWAVGGIAAGDAGRPRGRVVHWSGTSWTLDALSRESLAFTRVWGNSTSGIWMGGDEGTEVSLSCSIFHREPSARIFERMTIDAFDPEEGPIQGAPGTFTGGGIAADGRIVVLGRTLSAKPAFWYAAREDGGAFTWSYEARVLDDPQLRTVWAIRGGTTWVGGDYGRLRRQNGPSWTQAAITIAEVPVIEPLHAIWGEHADDFWVVGNDIAIHRTRTF